MKTAIYPGTFDPPTLGHLDIIERSSHIFDKLIVGIGENIKKDQNFFSLEQRIDLMKKVTLRFPNVEVLSFRGLLVDFAHNQKVKIIVRSIRTVFDFEFETLQSQINLKLGALETLFLAVNEKFRLVNASVVRELACHGQRLLEFVPEEIEEIVFQKLSTAKQKCC